jgi:hypothetical protein
MNFGFYTFSAALLALFAIPLIIFYFLKLKRPRVELPSLALWRQVMNDQRVNSPFQKFRRNILLFLQLLLLLLLVLAAMQPFWHGDSDRAERLPILIDNSASMGALDKAGGATRLQAAKDRVARIIDGLLPEQEVALISFSNTARRRTGFTNNKRVLREALAEIEVEDVPSDIEDALRMAQAMGRTASFEEALLISDGNFPDRANFDLSFKLNYQRLTPAGANIGITALNARRSLSGMWDVFAQIEASADSDVSAMVEVEQDGAAIAKDPVRISKGKSQRMVFRVSGEKASAISVRLVPDDFDSLASDNIAFLDLPAARSLWVYAAPTLPAFRHSLAAIGGIFLHPEDGGGNRSDSYDLLVTDQVADLNIEARTSLFIGIVPDDLKPLVEIFQSGGAVVDWRRTAPLLQHVELGDLVILDEPRATQSAEEKSFENLGYVVLAHGRRGPLLLEKRMGDRVQFFLLFHTDRSTLPYRVGFPILVSNLMQIAMTEAGISEARGNRTGMLPPLKMTAQRRYRVEQPRGGVLEVNADATGVVSAVPAPFTGKYVVKDGNTQVTVGASVLSASETALAGVQEIRFSQGLTVGASEATAKTDHSLWKYIALGGFLVLLVEWWFFNRRPRGT